MSGIAVEHLSQQQFIADSDYLGSVMFRLGHWHAFGDFDGDVNLINYEKKGVRVKSRTQSSASPPASKSSIITPQPAGRF